MLRVAETSDHWVVVLTRIGEDPYLPDLGETW